MNKYVDFKDLVGETLSRIEITSGNEKITFHCVSGKQFEMYHEPDCCESVGIEDIDGNLDFLIGGPILQAEESTNSDNSPEHSESHTWTFYRIATNRGQVVIRWLGTSNGYYSESVSFFDVTDYEKMPNLLMNAELLEKLKNNIL